MIKVGKRLATASIVYGIGDLLTRGAGILLIPVYTRLLAPMEYGIFAGVSVFISFMNVFLILGMHSAAGRMHFDSADEEKKRTLYGTLFIAASMWALILTIVLNIYGNHILGHFYSAVHFDPYLRLGTWIAFFNSLLLIPLALLQAQHRPLLYRIVTGSSFLISTCSILIFVIVMRWGVVGILWGQIVGGVLTASLAIFIMFRKMNWTVDRTILWQSLGFGVPVVFYAAGGWFADYSGRYFVERYSTLAELGLYNLASQYASILYMVFNAGNMAWAPVFYEIGSSPEGPRIAARIGLLLFTGGLGVALAMVIFGPLVFRIFIGDAFLGAFQFVPLLILSNILSTVIWCLVVLPLFYLKKTFHLAWLTIFSGCVGVLLNFLFASRWGALGAAMATCLTYFLVIALACYISFRLYPIPYQFKKIGLLILVVISLNVASTYTRFDSIILSSVTGLVLMILFLFSLFPLKIVTTSELRIAFDFVKRRLTGEAPETPALEKS